VLRRVGEAGLLWDRPRPRLWLSVNSHPGPSPPDVEAVWRDLHARLLSFIARRVSDRDSAEDILQEVMLRVHRHAAELNDVSAIPAWMHEIARNAIIDHYRRAVVRREEPVGSGLELERPAQAEPDLFPAEARAELASCLEPLLAQLAPIYREALQLTDIAGRTQAEAAAQVGLTTSGMKTRVQRGRAQLKALFTHCCEIAVDRRGGIIDYRARSDDCGCPSGVTSQHPTTVG
jgi:RNA polymerase sigma-70 factor (ECF subfamily)